MSAENWLVLRCGSSKTLQLAKRLNAETVIGGPRGAWTPVWKRRRRLPRSSVSRILTVAAIPSFVFVPEDNADDLPVLPGLPYSFMRIDGAKVVVADHELALLRKIDAQPKDPKVKLPHPGQMMRFSADSPFGGLKAKVVYCSNTSCKVVVQEFDRPVSVPPSLLESVEV